MLISMLFHTISYDISATWEMCSHDVHIQAHECSLPSLVWRWKGMLHICLKLEMYGSKLIWRHHRAGSLISTHSSIKRLNLLFADLISLAPPVPSHRGRSGNVIRIKLRTGQEQQSLDQERWVTVAIEIRKWDEGALMLGHARASLLQRPSDGQSLPREEDFLNGASEEDCRWESSSEASGISNIVPVPFLVFFFFKVSLPL